MHQRHGVMILTIIGKKGNERGLDGCSWVSSWLEAMTKAYARERPAVLIGTTEN